MVKGFFNYEATSGPDVEYSKSHVMLGGDDRALCGLNSKYFEKTLPITSPESIPDEVCKRCTNRVKSIIEAKKMPEDIPAKLTKGLTFGQYMDKGMKPYELVAHYFPQYTRRQQQYLLLKHTCYPLNPEMMVGEVKDLFASGVDIFNLSKPNK